MKQKADTYKKKRIVMGDENLVTNSEIHIKDVVKDLYGDTNNITSSNMKYYNIPEDDESNSICKNLLPCFLIIKTIITGKIVITSPGILKQVPSYRIISVGWNPDEKMASFDTGIITASEQFY